MPKALTIIADQIEAAQDTIIAATVSELSDNLDSFPGLGSVLSLFSKSAEGVMMHRVKTGIVPDLEEHTEAQLAYVEAVIEHGGPGDVPDAIEETLLETNPMLEMLDLEDAELEQVREELIAHSADAAETFADWVTAADSEEFDDFVALAVHLGKSGDDMATHLDEFLYYIDILDEHSEQIDPAPYGAMLTEPHILEWFVTNLLAGLETGREQVKDDVASAIDAAQ